MNKEQSIFSEDNEVKPNYWKLTTVGDSISGILVEKGLSRNTLKTPECGQKIYSILQDDGTVVMVGGRGNKDPQVIVGLESAQLGQMVGIKYVEEKPATKAGMHDAKILKVYTNGKIDEDKLHKFQGVVEDDTIPI